MANSTLRSQTSSRLNPDHGDSIGRRSLLQGTVLAAIAAPALVPMSASDTLAASSSHLSRSTVRKEHLMQDGGRSAPRLARMRQVMASHVEIGTIPGLVTLVSRRGQTHVEAIGLEEFDGSEPMERDTIFRIASVTKPIVAVAAMILVEECVLRLDDPVDPLLPELANRQVLRSIDSDIDDTVPAKRPITLRDLLTFQLGIGAIFAEPGKYPIQQALNEVGLTPGPMLPTVGPDEYMARIGSLPLLYQPGERWLYNIGSDILGVLIARATATSLGDFLQERIFTPLGMSDTGFMVPADKLDRLAGSYWTNFATGEFGVFDGIENSRYAQEPTFESGAGGLVSTADDLLAFGTMMLNGGRYEDVRIVSRPTIDLMTMDQLLPAQKNPADFFPGFWEGNGWGLGLSVNTKKINLATSPGRYGWDGGYGTSWYVDPAEELIGILLTQRVLDGQAVMNVYADFWTSAYQAIDD